MTERIGNTVIIAVEPDGKCEDCGAVAELRPYGPNGQRVCHSCAMKDPKGFRQRMEKMLFGEIDA